MHSECQSNTVPFLVAKDALAWIEENKAAYGKRHMLSLILGCALSASESAAETSRLLSKVEAMYGGDAAVVRV